MIQLNWKLISNNAIHNVYSSRIILNLCIIIWLSKHVLSIPKYRQAYIKNYYEKSVLFQNELKIMNWIESIINEYCNTLFWFEKKSENFPEYDDEYHPKLFSWISSFTWTFWNPNPWSFFFSNFRFLEMKNRLLNQPEIMQLMRSRLNQSYYWYFFCFL